MPRRTPLTVAAAGLAIAVLALVGAWALFGRRPASEVLDGVRLAGTDMGGRTADEIDEVLDELESRLTSDPIVVTTPKGDLAVEPAAVDLAVDREATRRRVMAAGRGEGVLAPLGWLKRQVAPIDTPVVVRVDEAKLDAALAETDPTGREEPVEPTLQVGADGRLAVVAGVPGRGLDGAPVARALEAAAADGDAPLEVDARSVELPPKFTEEDLAPLLEEATTLTARPVTVVAEGKPAEVTTELLRSWVTVDTSGTEPVLRLDAPKIAEGLGMLLPDVGRQAGEATVEVVGDRPTVVPGREGTRCCAPESAGLVLAALRSGAGAPVDVPLTVRTPRRDTTSAEKLGIVEKIGEFTTRHAAGESRVTNIHRMADLVRGAIIEPGGTFSVNEFVGQRTRAKGFVSGGVIENGVFSTSVGGGVSQFATTLFNAAFFGGLDFVEYQSHSIYISRYPYGREATLSFPKPDLILRNGSPYGVLIWTEYTSSSITVSLWSTRWATGEQTGQTTSTSGKCTVVRTERTRTFVDGRHEVDGVSARYRPSEGVNC
jgi:vancomycin resistance protein YoaR